MNLRPAIAPLAFAVAALMGCDAPTSAPASPQIDARLSRTTAAVHNSGFVSGSVTPNGAWRFDWNNTLQQWGRLHIEEPRRRLNDIACSDNPPPGDCGGFSGRSETRRAFVHVYLAEERTRGSTRTVLLFAWGDDEVFEAAVLADTPESRDLFGRTFELDADGVLSLVQAVTRTANDVIRGVTKVSNYYGEVNPPRNR